MGAFWKTKGNMFAFIKKEKKIKLKKYMGRIYYSPWNDTFFLVCGRRFRDNREGDFRRLPDLPGTLPHGPSWTLEILETFVLGPSLIKNKTQTAVINIVSFRIFINFTFRMLFIIHFQKCSKAVTVEENDDWGFSHDVTKVQTKKLSIFLSSLLSSGITAPENLFYKNFWFQRVIHFKDAWIFQPFGGGWIDERIGGFWKYFCPDFGFKARF